MKNVLKLWAFAALIPVAVMAQSSLDEEVNAELDKMYQSQPATDQRAQRAMGPAVQVNVQAQPAVTATQSNNQGTTQSASSTQIADQRSLQAQKQPTTVIQASPLVESKADLIRKNRQDAEVNTEQTIVEKLEESRLNDEKRRAEVLFGDKFNTLMSQGQQPATQPAQQQQPMQAAQPVLLVPMTAIQAQPVQAAQQTPALQPPAAVAPVTTAPVVMPDQQVTAPAPVIVERDEKADKLENKEEKLDRDAIRGEVSAALAEFKKDEEKPKASSYIAIMTGSGDYPDAVNVKGQYSLGIAYGRKFNDRVVAEGSFLFSNFQVEQPPTSGGANIYNTSTGQNDYYPRITEMNQYATSGLVKYQLLGGMLRPEVGGLMSYTYRTFSDKQFALSDAVVTSQAIDLGLMAGISVELSESFSLGLDYRHMWNMTNKVDGSTLQKSTIYQTPNYTPIEQLSYSNFSIVGRATF